MLPALGALLGAALFAGAAAAHPSVSLVMDSRGAVYYSDLTHVWVIQPDGSKRIAVRNVHTHELWIGAADTLYGEDVQNIGNRVQHRVWKRAPDGTVTDAIGWREGYPLEYADYGFARDRKGRIYVLRRDARRVEVRDRSDEIVRSVDLEPGDTPIGWLTVTPDGTAFVTIGPDLFRIASDGLPELVASDLVDRSEPFNYVHDRHALMGLWTADSDVYVAVLAGQVVKRIGTGGRVSIAARSAGEWSPSGGMVDSDGSLWLLEVSTANEVRVRRIGPTGEERLH